MIEHTLLVLQILTTLSEAVIQASGFRALWDLVLQNPALAVVAEDTGTRLCLQVFSVYRYDGFYKQCVYTFW